MKDLNLYFLDFLSISPQCPTGCSTVAFDILRALSPQERDKMQHEASICSAKVDENSFSISLNMQSLVEFAVGNTCNLVQAQIPAYLKNLKAGASNKMLQELFGIGRDTIKSHRDLLQIPSPICHRYGTEEVDRVLYEWSRHMVKNPAEKASESILKVSTAARVRVSICWSILKRQNKV